MNSMLRIVALALTSAVTLSASLVSVAPAEEFKNEAAHWFVTGSGVGTDVYQFNAGPMRCNNTAYSGTSTEQNSTKLSVSATYAGCTAFGFVNTKVDTNGCEHQFTTGLPNSVHIVCPAGTSIVITAFNCEVTIPSQTVVGGITYDNEGSGKTMDVRATFSLSGLTYIQHEKSFPFCNEIGTSGLSKTSLFHDGTLSAEATFTATNTSEEHLAFTVE
jgi:hypothetical protein